MVRLVYYAGPTRIAMSTDINGYSCQHYAAHFGHKHILQFFMKRNAETKSIVSEKTNTSLLHIAVKKGHLDLVRFMLGKETLKKTNF